MHSFRDGSTSLFYGRITWLGPGVTLGAGGMHLVRQPELTSPPSTVLLTEVLSEADAVRNCEKGTWQYKRLLCKIQEIPILDVVLKLSIQYQETYLELKGLVFGLSLFDYYNYLTKLHLVLISSPCSF